MKTFQRKQNTPKVRTNADINNSLIRHKFFQIYNAILSYK
jgi:hypothetical protein